MACIAAATLQGVTGHSVTVEGHVSNGLPGFTVVGLPDTSCREARDRVRAAILSSGLAWPLKRITVNLAPSGLRKEGAALDLAIAVGVLVADGNLSSNVVENVGFLGELGLDGSIRPIPGALPLTDSVVAAEVVVPVANAYEAGLIGRHLVRPARDLADLVAILTGEFPWPPCPEPEPDALPDRMPDLADVRG